MHGMLFSSLKNYIEDVYGEHIWHNALKNAGLEGKIYLSSNIYSDEELMSIVNQLSTLTNTSIPQLLENFAVKHFDFYINTFMINPKKYRDVLDFLQDVNEIVHKPIISRSPLVRMPKFTVIRTSDFTLELTYVSKRKLCPFVKGVIKGAGKYFNQKLHLREERCMLKGDPECHILISKLVI